MVEIEVLRGSPPFPAPADYPHGLINWCCERRCPLYPQKQTLAALQSFGLKKRTSEVRFTPESGHKWLGRGMSAFDPKRTLRQAALDVRK